MNRFSRRFIYRFLAEHGMKGKTQGALKEECFSRPGRPVQRAETTHPRMKNVEDTGRG
jgi:hypothetical protein